MKSLFLHARNRLWHSKRRCGEGERGAVTAELAVGLPVVVMLLAVILTLGAVSSAQLRSQDAARAGARAMALGQSTAQASQAVSKVAGDGATWEFHRDGEWVRVDVWRPVLTGKLRLAPLRAHGQAYGWLEP